MIVGKDAADPIDCQWLREQQFYWHFYVHPKKLTTDVLWTHAWFSKSPPDFPRSMSGKMQISLEKNGLVLPPDRSGNYLKVLNLVTNRHKVEWIRKIPVTESKHMQNCDFINWTKMVANHTPFWQLKPQRWVCDVE